MRWIIVALLFVGCASKELDPATIKELVRSYFTPYSSFTIIKDLDVDVLWIKPLAPDRAIAKVCYTASFAIGYAELVERIKRRPNSFLARFDFGLVALLGRKFGNFRRGDRKSRCDEVEFARRYGRWRITKI